MAKRVIGLTDARDRDAHVEIEAPRRRESHGYINPAGRPVRTERFIKLTESRHYDVLLAAHGDDVALAEALVAGDPEIDFEKAGRRVGMADRVHVKADGTVLYCANTLMVQLNPAGEEVQRTEFIDVEATVDEETALKWSGRLFPIDDVVRRFVIGRKLRVRHVNGLTFDFLHEIASELHKQKKMLLVGSGKRGIAPLIFQKNGAPYRGFLEGRVDGDGYLLVLHLSNLELKAPAAAKEGE